MKAVEANIVGISFRETGDKTIYTLVLGINGTGKTIPIVIGPYEAVSIMKTLISPKTTRPNAHDLISALLYQRSLYKGMILAIIYKLQDNIYYSKIVIETANNELIEIESKPSDAIAVGIRCKAPLFISTEVARSAPSISKDEIERFIKEGKFAPNNEYRHDSEINKIDYSPLSLTNFRKTPKASDRRNNRQKPLESCSTQELKSIMEEAINNENYELAQEIKDILDQRGD